ncbi:MAG: glycosyltransferase 87 family protein, partial [Candidatus Levyibacteriota bacterium]
VLLLLTFYLYQKNRQISSGIIFAFAMLLKPIFGFFLLFFFLKNQWKLVFISIGAGLTIFLIFSLLFPQKQFGTEYYVFSFVPHLLNPSGREIYYNQGIIGFVARLMPNLFLRVGVDALYSVLLLTFLYLERKKQHNYVFSLFLISLVLIDTLSWQHHFVFLIFPFLFIGKRLLKSGTLLEKTLLICSYFLISGNIKNPSIFASFPSSLVLSHVFYGAIILFWLVISNRNISGKTTSLSAPQAKSKK